MGARRDWCSREPADRYGRDLIACGAIAKRGEDDACTTRSMHAGRDRGALLSAWTGC